MRNGLPRWQRFRYVSGCRRDVRLVIELAQLNVTSRLLDIGFGTGRLAQGILDTLGSIARYTGVEVSHEHVAWCHTRFAQYAFAEFLEVDMANDRYRPSGSKVLEALPLPADAYDVACLFSVFTHLLPGDVDFYLAELSRVLVPGGKVIATFYRDDESPEHSVNPKDAYGPYENSPLHRVRYNRRHLAEAFSKHGFTEAGNGIPWLQNQELVILESR